MIELRALKKTDKTRLASLANNKRIWDNVRDAFPHPYQLSDAEFFINLVKKENPRQTFAIEYNGELCGVTGLVIQKDIYKKSAELGYWIGEAYWGMGIATKTVELITNYGFNTLKLNRIFAGVFEFNVGSMKVLEKNGYEKEGIFKKAVLKNEVLMDEHRYFRLNQNYSSITTTNTNINI